MRSAQVQQGAGNVLLLMLTPSISAGWLQAGHVVLVRPHMMGCVRRYNAGAGLCLPPFAACALGSCTALQLRSAGQAVRGSGFCTCIAMLCNTECYSSRCGVCASGSVHLLP
jgi:hypothetical protein